MIFTDKDFVLDKVRNGARFWHVAEKELDKKFIQEQDLDIDPDTSADILARTFDSLQGVIYVQISNFSKGERVKNSDHQTGTYRYFVKLLRAPSQSLPPVSGPTVPLDQFLTVYNQLNLANMDKFRLEMQLDNLRNEKPDRLESILSPFAESFKTNPQGTINAIGSIFKPKVAPAVARPESDFNN